MWPPYSPSAAGCSPAATPERDNRDMGAAGPASMTRLAAAAVRAPFTGRARRELLFCLLGLPFGFFIPLAGFFAIAWLAARASGPPWADRGNPSSWAVLAAAAVAVLLAALLGTTRPPPRPGRAPPPPA